MFDSWFLPVGEEKFSYGYGGTGKSSTDCKFQDYGQTFTVDDVIGAYLVRVPLCILRQNFLSSFVVLN